MLSFIFFTILLTITTSANNITDPLRTPFVNRLSEDGRLLFNGLAAKYGYPAEGHDVVTEDGYILKLFHIPGNKSRAVLLVHGNTPTSDCWIIRGKSSLAITLARKNYDVWAINLRGNTYSRRHLYLDPDKNANQFYNFTFYEQGIYDIPSTIDYILKRTGEKQILTIGHSVGTTVFYVLGSEKPEYNKKIKLAISLAPICYLDNLRGILQLAPTVGPLFMDIMESLRIPEIFSHKQSAETLQAICLSQMGYDLCIKLGFFGVLGYDEAGYEPGFSRTFLGHFPGGSSTKTFRHLIQIISKSAFAKYDYGPQGNLVVYNNTKAPLFDLGKVTMKSAIFVGREDFLGTVRDSQRLKASLPNLVHYQLMPYKTFNHADFVWGREMPVHLYPYLLPLIEKYI